MSLDPKLRAALERELYHWHVPYEGLDNDGFLDAIAPLITAALADAFDAGRAAQCIYETELRFDTGEERERPVAPVNPYRSPPADHIAIFDGPPAQEPADEDA